MPHNGAIEAAAILAKGASLAGGRFGEGVTDADTKIVVTDANGFIRPFVTVSFSTPIAVAVGPKSGRNLTGTSAGQPHKMTVRFMSTASNEGDARRLDEAVGNLFEGWKPGDGNADEMVTRGGQEFQQPATGSKPTRWMKQRRMTLTVGLSS